MAGWRAEAEAEPWEQGEAMWSNGRARGGWEEGVCLSPRCGDTCRRRGGLGAQQGLSQTEWRPCPSEPDGRGAGKGPPPGTHRGLQRAEAADPGSVHTPPAGWGPENLIPGIAGLRALRVLHGRGAAASGRLPEGAPSRGGRSGRTQPHAHTSSEGRPLGCSLRGSVWADLCSRCGPGGVGVGAPPGRGSRRPRCRGGY